MPAACVPGCIIHNGRIARPMKRPGSANLLKLGDADNHPRENTKLEIRIGVNCSAEAERLLH